MTLLYLGNSSEKEITTEFENMYLSEIRGNHSQFIVLVNNFKIYFEILFGNYFDSYCYHI